MNIKETMADLFMGKMSSEDKKDMMDSMMNKFFENMSSDEKQKMITEMMNKFMSNMTAEEKQAMMQNMMPAMMGNDPSSPMKNMMNMMGMMMGGSGRAGKMKSSIEDKTGTESQTEMPWDMCKNMMMNMNKTSELATFATPEVRELFEEWAAQIEEEILDYIKDTDNNNVSIIAEHFKLSKDSVNYFLTRLSRKGKIKLKAQKAE